MLSSFNNLSPSRLPRLKRELPLKHSDPLAELERRRDAAIRRPSQQPWCQQSEGGAGATWQLCQQPPERPKPSPAGALRPLRPAGICVTEAAKDTTLHLNPLRILFPWTAQDYLDQKRFKTGENLGKGAILTGSSQNLISTGHLFKVTGQSVDNMVHVFCSRYDFKH